LIVVDQTERHHDSTQAFLDRNEDRIRLIRPSFKSANRARNTGIQEAKGEVLLFCDDDVDPEPGFVRAHWEAHGAPGAGVAAVTGPFIVEGERLLSREALDSEQLHAIDEGKQSRFDLGFPYQACWAPAANLSVHRSWIEKIGGFDEYFHGVSVGDDAEFCHRIQVHGGRIQYTPAAKLLHRPEPTGGCRDEEHLGKRMIDLVDNSHYYWVKIGMTRRDRARAFSQVFYAQLSNRDLRQSIGIPRICLYYGYATALTLWRCRHVRSNWEQTSS
jgi:GT2 family glycosyltransferase